MSYCILDSFSFLSQVILIVILWHIGEKDEPQANQEVEEEDPYEGMDYQEQTELYVSYKRSYNEMLQYRIWNQFVKLTQEDEDAEDAEIDR